MTTSLKNAKLGFILSIFTAFIWGSVPIALKEVMEDLDAPTLVWYRFLIAFIILLPILAVKKDLPFRKIQQKPKSLILLSILTLGIVGNFILLSKALVYTTPTVVQIVIQLSSVGLLFAGVIVFKEHLSRTQLLGVIILVTGLLMFFNKNLIEMIASFNDYSLGVVLALLGALSWVFFALAQKVVLRDFSSLQILLILNALGMVFLLPFVNFSTVLTLSNIKLILLAYCGLNTVLGYGALAEAMRLWEVSKVSAMITFTPLFTLVFSLILALMWPTTFENPNLNVLGYIGVFIVVFGAMFMVIGETLIRSLTQKRVK